MWVQSPPEEQFFPKNGCLEKINLIIHDVNIHDIWCLPNLPKDVNTICYIRGPMIRHR